MPKAQVSPCGRSLPGAHSLLGSQRLCITVQNMRTSVSNMAGTSRPSDLFIAQRRSKSNLAAVALCARRSGSSFPRSQREARTERRESELHRPHVRGALLPIGSAPREERWAGKPRRLPVASGIDAESGRHNAVETLPAPKRDQATMPGISVAGPGRCYTRPWLSLR